MTQAASIKNRSSAVHYGLYLSKRNFKFGILSLCMNFLGLPMLLIQALYGFNSLLQDNAVSLPIDGIYYFIAVICTAVAVLTGVFTAMGSFAHLYNKQLVDMELSLPLTADKRFFAGYLSGLAMYLLPYIFCQIISAILLFVGGRAVDSLNNESYSRIVTKYTPICLKLIFGVFIVMLMFYTLFVLTMSFCGSKFETSSYGVGSNFCLPVIYACIYYIIANYGYGMVFKASDNNFVNNLFGCTSPIGAFYGLVLTIVYTEGDYSFFSVYSFGFWVIKNLLFTAVLLFCAWMLYRRRKAEQTGKTFIYKTFYLIVMICLMMIICCFFNMLDVGIIPLITVTMVIFLIMDSISNRGIRKLHHSLVKYIFVMAGIIAVYCLTVKTDIFGAVNYVPKASDVKSVELVDYVGYNGTDSYIGNYHLEDEENIQAVIDAHTEQLSEYKAESRAYARIPALYIRYTLKNGQVKERRYTSVYPSAYEKLLPIEVSDEIKASKLAAINNTLSNAPFVVMTDSDASDFDRVNASSGSFGEAFSSKLMECLTEDINSMTLEDYARFNEDSRHIEIHPNNDYQQQLQLYGSYYNELYITGAYEKTLEYFNSLGVSGENKEIYTANDIFEIDCIKIYKMNNKYEIPIHMLPNLDENVTAVIYDPDRYNNSNYIENKIAFNELSYKDAEELTVIIFNSLPYYIPVGEYYAISIDGYNLMYVPQRYNNIIESIIL